jgi:hypothetical protein
MSGLVMLCGIYIAIEAIVSLWWSYNDKGLFPQCVRVSRIIVGVFICWASNLIK